MPSRLSSLPCRMGDRRHGAHVEDFRTILLPCRCYVVLLCEHTSTALDAQGFFGTGMFGHPGVALAADSRCHESRATP